MSHTLRVDLLVSAWLPARHDTCLAPFEREVTKATVLYEPYCIWAVPDYLPEDEVAEDDKGRVYAGDYEHGTPAPSRLPTAARQN